MRDFEEYQNGVLIASGQHDIGWDKLRRIRDAALEESDWRALKDVTLTTQWRDFRAALRSLPQDFPDSANDACDNFPVMPDE